MPKRLTGLLLVLSVTVSAAGLARAQTPAGSATPAPTDSLPAPAAAADSSPRLFSVNEIVAIGAGAIVGGMLFQATMVHGLALVGAAAGGWLGDWMYNQHPAHTKVGG